MRIINSEVNTLFELLNQFLRFVAGQFEREPRVAAEIDRLDEHRSEIAEIEARYINCLLNTQPCDRDRAEAAISALYEHGRQPPPQFIWLDSPMEAALAMMVVVWASLDGIESESIAVRKFKCLEDPILLLAPVARLRFSDRLLALSDPRMRMALFQRHLQRIRPLEWVGADILRQVELELLPQVRTKGNELNVWMNTWNKLVETPLPDWCIRRLNLSAEMLYTLTDWEHREIMEKVLDDLVSQGGGNHPAYGQFQAELMATYEMLGLLGRESHTLFEVYRDIIAQCGMTWPFNKICLMVDRPRVLAVSPNMLLHKHDTRAVQYKDGWGFYAIEGVVVPETVAQRNFTATEIDRQQNMEIKRAMIARYGAGEYLRDTGAVQLQKDSFGSLYLKNVGDEEPLVVVELKNSTAEPDGTFKTYFLRVPPEIRTARAAVAWSFGMEPSDYNPTVES